MLILIPPSEGKTKIKSTNTIFADTKFKFEREVNQVIRLLSLLNEEDLIKTLNCIKSHMHKKSKLYIDIFVPPTLFISRSENKKMKICEFFDSIIKQESTIYEELSYNDKNEIMHVRWFYESEGKVYNKFTFDMKMYYPDTMNRILTEQNFKILNLWGDYNQSSFNEESNLQIYQCVLNNEQ